MIHLLDAGFLTSVQDLGRSGYQQYGVPTGGPMDEFALRAANALVRNPPDAAVLEVGLAGIRLGAGTDLIVAVTGAGFEARIQGRRIPLWMSARLDAGHTLTLTPVPGGCWAYIAFSGGVDVPPVMGSRATALNAGLGGLAGRALRSGDQVPCGPSTAGAQAGSWLPPEYRPPYRMRPTLEIISGPQYNDFTLEGQAALLFGEFAVRPDSDRMGYRLEGPAIIHRGKAELLSEGLVRGAIQVPASGQPLVMMSERPTTGGYPKIGVIASADLPLLAQSPPGIGVVRFRLTEVEAARLRWCTLLERMIPGIVDIDDPLTPI